MYLKSELGKRQFFSFATTKRDNVKEPKEPEKIDKYLGLCVLIE